MANCLLAFNNKVTQAATLSGGDWLASLPLTNLQDPTIGLVARSNGLALSATKFLVDIGVDSAVRAAALAAHNFSLDAKVRIRASEDDPAMVSNVLFDTGWFDVWPAVYNTEDLDWEAPNFWSGQYTEEERAGLTWTLIKSSEDNIYARYWLFEIDDVSNANGYVQIGRPFIGEGWQPTINMKYGVGIGLEDPSDIDEAISGAESYGERPKYRVSAFTIENLGVDEAFGRGFDLMRRVGTTKEVLFQYDPEDTLHALRRSYLGRLRKLSQVEHPNVEVYGIAYEIKERL